MSVHQPVELQKARVDTCNVIAKFAPRGGSPTSWHGAAVTAVSSCRGHHCRQCADRAGARWVRRRPRRHQCRQRASTSAESDGSRYQNADQLARTRPNGTRRQEQRQNKGSPRPTRTTKPMVNCRRGQAEAGSRLPKGRLALAPASRRRPASAIRRPSTLDDKGRAGELHFRRTAAFARRRPKRAGTVAALVIEENQSRAPTADLRPYTTVNCESARRRVKSDFSRSQPGETSGA